MMLPKGRLGIWAFFYFFLSSDKKCKKPDDGTVDRGGANTKHMKIVFIRHGESEWNAVFNEGSKITLPIRLVVALFHEARMIFDQDSLFMDSPLSEVGIEQAWKLMSVLASAPAKRLEPEQAKKPVEQLEVNDMIAIIRGDAGESILASSILRRALSTGLIALSPRLLKKTQSADKVQVMTNLQEISRNVDTLALAPAKTSPKIPRSETKIK